jgi:hypothetical protein
VVERHLAKVDVVSSNLIARSKIPGALKIPGSPGLEIARSANLPAEASGLGLFTTAKSRLQDFVMQSARDLHTLWRDLTLKRILSPVVLGCVCRKNASASFVAPARVLCCHVRRRLPLLSAPSKNRRIQTQ